MKVERAVGLIVPPSAAWSHPPSSVPPEHWRHWRGSGGRGGGTRLWALASAPPSRCRGSDWRRSLRPARATADGWSPSPSPTARLRQGRACARAAAALGSRIKACPWPTFRRRSSAACARAPEGIEAVGALDRPAGILRDPQAVGLVAIERRGTPARPAARTPDRRRRCRAGHRHAQRAERARPGQFPEEDVAQILAHQRRAPLRAWRASRRRWPPSSRRRAGAGCAREAAARPRHIRGRSGRHSRSASPRRRAASAGPTPGCGGRIVRSDRPPSRSPAPPGERAILDLGAGVIEDAWPS